MSELIVKKWIVESSYSNGEKNPWNVGYIFDFRVDSSFVKYNEKGNILLNGKWFIDETNKIMNIKDYNIPSSEQFFITQLDENNLRWSYPWWGKSVQDNLIAF